MYAILTSISVSKIGFLAYLVQRKLEIQVEDIKISLPAVSTPLFFSFPCARRFLFSVTVDGKTVSKPLRFTEKEITLVFTFNSISVDISLNLVKNTWSLLDTTIQEYGLYCGKRYYVENSTLESSYENVFSEAKLFPSFHKRESNDKCFYIDVINKIVIGTNPKTRKATVVEKLKRLLEDAYPKKIFVPHKVIINRNSLLSDAWRSYLPAFKTKSFYEILISFTDEIGEDQGGLRREFLYLLFNELVKDRRIDKSTAIYDVDPTIRCPEFIYFYRSRKEQIDVLEDMTNGEFLTTASYYVVLGVVIGSLLLLSETLQFNFSLIFYENLLGRNFTLKHLQDIELQGILNKNMMSYESTEYVRERFFEPKKNHYDHIKFGFDLALCSFDQETAVLQKLKEKFTAFDFPFLFYHFEPVNMEKLKCVVDYVNCTALTMEVQWLWQALGMKDQMFISKFLQFITGSGNLPNIVRGCVFTIEKRPGKNELFKSSACIKRLYMCSFDTFEHLSESLEMSVLNAEGFHFV